jgi:hypothetical protein
VVREERSIREADKRLVRTDWAVLAPQPHLLEPPGTFFLWPVSHMQANFTSSVEKSTTPIYPLSIALAPPESILLLLQPTPHAIATSWPSRPRPHHVHLIPRSSEQSPTVARHACHRRDHPRQLPVATPVDL